MNRGTRGSFGFADRAELNLVQDRSRNPARPEISPLKLVAIPGPFASLKSRATTQRATPNAVRLAAQPIEIRWKAGRSLSEARSYSLAQSVSQVALSASFGAADTFD